MKLSPYINLNRIEFSVTYNCTGRCIHCSVADKLHSEKEYQHVRENAAVETIKWLANHFPITSVMTFGGEPLLYPEIVGAVHTGVQKVRLQPAWVVNKEHENPYNQRTKEILADFADLNLSVASGNDIFLAGNAAKYLAEYYDVPKLDLLKVCGTMPYTDALTDIKSLSIVPNGDVMICSYVIGNIYRE
uniref:radical SAM protein n=1 Tax=Acetatifactor sp. TaxID=1872090 RepID=UPI004055FC58